VLLGFATVLVGVVGVTTVYIPHYSDFGPAKERREEFLTKGNIIDPSSSYNENGTKRPGSMYENMNKQAKKL
jgi:hypothetical protein